MFVQIWLCRNLWNDAQITGALFEVCGTVRLGDNWIFV